MGKEPSRSRGPLALVAIALLAALVYAAVRLLGGLDRLAEYVRSPSGELLVIDQVSAWPLIAALGLAGLAALIGWGLSLRHAGDLGEERRAREEAESELGRLRKELESSREKASAEREESRRERDRYERQREIARELRERVHELHAEQGGLGDHADVRVLVLRVAMRLLDADKGLLLSRSDGDGDGDLDLVAAEGFDRDPEHSALAQRFAGEVIEQGEVVRQSREELRQADGSGADAEIENLVAIPIYIRDRLDGVVVCANGAAIEQEDETLLALGDHAGTILENSRLHGELRTSYLATVTMLADALEIKDPFLRGHSNEVSGLVRAMAARLELSAIEREQLIFGSLLHDIGKIGISERILLKPGPLTPEEFGAIKLHPRIGYRLVAHVPLLLPVAPAILHHHERFDGSGYPAGLAGERIPLEARVIAIIDAFSAMISDRPYQAAVPVEDALTELERCAGTHFDPALVSIFVEEVRVGGALESEDGEVSLAEALDDPELQALREAGDHVFGSFAAVDGLTLLRNHRSFREALGAECERAGLPSQEQGFSLLLLETSRLSAINEQHGYAAGDRQLRLLGQALESAATAGGATAARDSGTRFAMLIPGAPLATAEAVEAELRGQVPETLGVRAACVEWRRDEGPEELIARARASLGPGAAQPDLEPV